ncbi:MAG: hypothetical protein CAPSK01_001864 [Candidatus Accumulibacter vicinus]|uniref:Uncharacterized protein n=1 Tax=Candidatus Accumulibacter vicinus TaxID=2954382 RepID=A0A084Y174_9PROT|nr:MAG: hypothetical protein CAPSK01_001864 [Candidatus Accumulibacter vicinus]
MQSIRPKAPSSAKLPPRSAEIGVCSPAQPSIQPIASDNLARSSVALRATPSRSRTCVNCPALKFTSASATHP